MRFPPLEDTASGHDGRPDDGITERRRARRLGWVATALTRLRGVKASQPRLPAAGLDEGVMQRIRIPILHPSEEDRIRDGYRTQGHRLARQEMWDDLSTLILGAEATRAATPGGASVALLLAHGAQTDVIRAARDAINDGKTPDARTAPSLEDMQAEAPGDHVRAMVTALTHVGIARAWQRRIHAVAAHGKAEHAAQGRIQEHLEIAERLLAPFDPTERDAPTLAAVACRAAEVRGASADEIVSAYDLLIGLDPDCACHMRAFGLALARSGKNYSSTVEEQARRVGAHSEAVWGLGGYAWAWMDVLARDPAAAEAVDLQLFRTALMDIMDCRGEQHIVNEWAAFCTLLIAPERAARRPSAAAEAVRAGISETADWLIARHLREIHPMIWARTLVGPGQPSPAVHRVSVDKGRMAALEVIAARFPGALRAGGRLVVGARGMYRLPAD